VRCERLAAPANPAALAAELRALIPSVDSVSDVVAEIINAVREQGDGAVREYTRRFDTHAAEPADLRVSEAELEAAASGLDRSVRAALERSIANVRRVAEAGLHPDRGVHFGGHQVVLREAPVARAAVYVPGGRAPYPSTVVMGVVTARVAGVPEISVCTPLGREGHPLVLAACHLTGASAVYRMGGVQAVAAFAYGTESVPAVDVIVGPGNAYVQEAKRQVFGQVGIDGFAGPSDLVAIADGPIDPAPLALDLLAQAEHGPGTLVVAVSSSPELLGELGERVLAADDTGAVGAVVDVTDMEQALAFAEAFAPEHLELVGADAEALATRVTRSGCVLVGPDSGTAFGDYVAGSNHILPTGSSARFSSVLSPAHFRRRFSEVRIGAAASELARTASPLARAEGFELHALSMEARIRDNGQR
jgi:histidinol dehydrogenase